MEARTELGNAISHEAAGAHQMPPAAMHGRSSNFVSKGTQEVVVSGRICATLPEPMKFVPGASPVIYVRDMPWHISMHNGNSRAQPEARGQAHRPADLLLQRAARYLFAGGQLICRGHVLFKSLSAPSKWLP